MPSLPARHAAGRHSAYLMMRRQVVAGRRVQGRAASKALVPPTDLGAGFVRLGQMKWCEVCLKNETWRRRRETGVVVGKGKVAGGWWWWGWSVHLQAIWEGSPRR